MKHAGLTVLVLVIGLSLSLANCVYAGKTHVVITGEDEEEHGEKAFLGIYMADVSEEVIENEKYKYNKGVLVMEVIDDSPAEGAGLQEDDIIYIFDGNKVDDTKSFSRLVNGKKPGDRVEIVFFRRGDRKRVNVNLSGKKRDSYTVRYDWDEYAEKMGKMGKRIGKSVGGVFDKYFTGNSIGGLKLSDIDKDMAQYFNVDKDNGILVTGISGGSSAEKAGIKSGDIIIEVNGKRVISVKDYKVALKDCDSEFKLVVIRRGEKLKFHFKAEDLEKRKYFELNDKRIYKLKIPGENERFEILSKDDIYLDNKLNKLEPLNKELVIIKGEKARYLEKNLKDIEYRMKDIEERLKNLKKNN